MSCYWIFDVSVVFVALCLSWVWPFDLWSKLLLARVSYYRVNKWFILLF